MLGDHNGFEPLGEKQSAVRDKLARAALPAMARLKVGKDVTLRRKLISSALQQVSDQDRHWIESFASNLTGDGRLQAAEAEAVAFSAAWAVIDKGLADEIRMANGQGSDPFTGSVIKTMISAAPEFGKRVLDSKIDSDEVMLRVALAHIFRRDPSSAFQMFVIDAVARLAPKAMKMSLGQIVKFAIERHEDSPAPDDAWGYVVALRDLTGKQGFYLFEPTQQTRANYDALAARLAEVMPDVSTEEVTHHILAAACSGYLYRGALQQFMETVAVAFERMDMQYGILYASEKSDAAGDGTTTQVFDIPATSVEEARRVATTMPQVAMHDDFRNLTEFLAQMADEKELKAKGN